MFPIPLNQLNDQQRHDYILKNFILNKSNSTELRRYKRDIDVIKDNHRFLWQDGTEDQSESNWEERLARRYYDKLFKEYCIADLNYYKHNKVALRWRIESEVVSGKGQFQCGSRKCEAREDLRTWEVNFAYMEQGGKKNALVKLRLCPEHSAQLNYTSQKREVKRLKKQAGKARKEHKRSKHKEADNLHKTLEHTVQEAQAAQVTETATVADKIVELPVVVPDTSENIWNKKVEIENEQETREQEFERYLEDLLF